MPGRNTRKRISAAVAGALLLLFVLPSGGCGRKGPPVGPKRPPLPQATELKGRLEGDTVHLAWRRPAASPDVRGYSVLRARSSAADPPCPGCPLVFEEAGVLTMEQGLESFEFTEPVAAGFTYTYKVRPIGPTGEGGQDSNSVVIDRSGSAKRSTPR